MNTNPTQTEIVTLNVLCVRNPSVSLSPTLSRNEKVEHYIRIKTHKLIVLRFWVESGVNALYGWAQVSLVLYLPSETPSINLTSCLESKTIQSYIWLFLFLNTLVIDFSRHVILISPTFTPMPFGPKYTVLAPPRT